jgi:hypothetical protein
MSSRAVLLIGPTPVIDGAACRGIAGPVAAWCHRHSQAGSGPLPAHRVTAPRRRVRQSPRYRGVRSRGASTPARWPRTRGALRSRARLGPPEWDSPRRPGRAGHGSGRDAARLAGGGAPGAGAWDRRSAGDPAAPGASGAHGGRSGAAARGGPVSGRPADPARAVASLGRDARRGRGVGAGPSRGPQSGCLATAYRCAPHGCRRRRLMCIHPKRPGDGRLRSLRGGFCIHPLPGSPGCIHFDPLRTRQPASHLAWRCIHDGG